MAMRSSATRDGPSINDYWREFVQQAKVAYNDAMARGDPVGLVQPPNSIKRRARDRRKTTPIDSERMDERPARRW
jgi:hypothetical protein